MRKYIFLSLFMLFCFFVFSINVNAACAAGVSVGDGTLVIKSQMPIVAADFDRESISYSSDGDVSIVKISGPDENSLIEEGKEEKQSTDDVSGESSDNKLLLMAILLSICVSVVCLVVCVVYFIKNNKSKK